MLMLTTNDVELIEIRIFIQETLIIYGLITNLLRPSPSLIHQSLSKAKSIKS